jgi:hypothetical protein
MSTIMTKQPAQSSPPRRMTVDEFEELEQSLGGARIELIDGRIARRDDMNPPRVVTTGRTKRAIESILPSGRYIRKDRFGQYVPVVLDGTIVGPIAADDILPR